MASSIYEGSVSVARADYSHTVHDNETDKYVELPIDGLDDRVATIATLSFTLDYPFDSPFHGTVVTDAGPTLRQIIEAVRAAYRTMYRGTVAQDLPLAGNKLVTGEYGRAFHVIEDLVIESIDIDEAAARLEIGIGS